MKKFGVKMFNYMRICGQLLVIYGDHIGGFGCGDY